MAQRTDVERGRAVVERWCALAEQRLDYLIALHDSGRWRRFHSEPDFLDNVREAKAAVETWRLLASREAALDNQPVDFGWLGQGAVPLAQRDDVTRADCAVAAVSVASPSVASRSVTSRSVTSPSVAPAAEPDADAALALPLPSSGQAANLDLAVMQDRYPLLRNAL